MPRKRQASRSGKVRHSASKRKSAKGQGGWHFGGSSVGKKKRKHGR